jgi:hypothetical protein
MKNKKNNDELDALIDEIIVDAYGDDEQLWAFRQVFEDELTLPKEAFVIGEAVTVLAFEYEHERRGVTARYRLCGCVPSVARHRALSSRQSPHTTQTKKSNGG